MSDTGHVENGTVVLDELADLPEGAKVRVELVPEENQNSAETPIPTLYERLRNVVGKVNSPVDAALNHDYYLYGQPKK